MEQIPVISVNLSGLESNPGFKLTLPLLKKVAYGAVFGDILMKCVYRMRPYELEEGIVNQETQNLGTACDLFLKRKQYQPQPV